MPASDDGGGAASVLLRPPPGLAVEQGLEGDDEVILSFPLGTGARSHAPLTGAEEAVLADLLLGYSNAEISERRRVSVRTVANQLAALFRKLGVHSRLEAARIAAERMSQKQAGGVRGVAHLDSSVAQVSGRSDNMSENVTLFRPVDRMG